VAVDVGRPLLDAETERAIRARLRFQAQADNKGRGRPRPVANEIERFHERKTPTTVAQVR